MGFGRAAIARHSRKAVALQDIELIDVTSVRGLTWRLSRNWLDRERTNVTAEQLTSGSLGPPNEVSPDLLHEYAPGWPVRWHRLHWRRAGNRDDL